MPNALVSLVPSLTEFLIDIGVGGRLVGRTKFCIHPAQAVEAIPTFGGTKNPNVERLRQIRPDLVVMNREENRKEDAEAIAQFTKVHMTEIVTVEDALREMEILGRTVNAEPPAAALVRAIRAQLATPVETPALRAAYFIWRKPWMVAGSSTYIDNVMRRFNLANIFADRQRYPEIDAGEIASLKPDVLLLSSEPYPFTERHREELRQRTGCPRVELVDGTWFSWYGSRMLPAFQNLQKWRREVDI